ncbi:MAG TPA: DUF3298 domain-containing protein [Spirochaetota bacterium]|nr:DUF3298 domain-containing protein [Spirochaetota bacterium]
MNKNIFCLLLVIILIWSCKNNSTTLKKNKDIKFETINIEKNFNPDSTEDSTNFIISYVKISDFGKKNIADLINKDILKLILTDEDGSLYQTTDELINSFFNGYKSFMGEFPEISIPWATEKKVSVISALNNTICIGYNVYYSTGGAHPNYYTNYYNYNIVTGNILTLKDIVINDKMDSLLKIAESKFRIIKEIPDGEEYETIGFTFPDGVFYLSNNFYFTEDKIVFYYNTYEIAPYVLGPTEIEIDLKDLKEIINFSNL